MVDAPTRRITWAHYYRLINSAYPPIDLFEDIADPEDWLLLGMAEGRSNARLAETVGQLDLIPADRRVGGAGASYVMSAFTHFSVDKPGRFNTSGFGAFYAADSFETAVFETVHHQNVFLSATDEAEGWIADKRELIGSIDADLIDVCEGYEALLHPDDYGPAQAFASVAKGDGANGIVYPSVRHDTGTCFAAFYPDVMAIPQQGRHLSYHWDGRRVDLIKTLSLDGANEHVFEVRP